MSPRRLRKLGGLTLAFLQGDFAAGQCTRPPALRVGSFATGQIG